MNIAAKPPADRRPCTAVTPSNRNELWARSLAGGLFLASAAFTLSAARSMSGGMRMPGGWEMSMMWMAMPGQSTIAAGGIFLLMWLAMMIAMMLPSSWPMLEVYRKVAGSRGAHPALATTLVGVGYFAVWLAFGALVFGAGFAASTAAMRSVAFSRAMPLVAGAGLIFAGAYQLSPWKQACLSHCRSPLMFLAHVFRPRLTGALRVGVTHGLYCTGCCWALMLMQTILGVMSLSVMILVAVLIGAEKLWAQGPLLARATGAASIGLGGFFLLRAAAIV
jgi:predicted metal-binding membrane protein